MATNGNGTSNGNWFKAWMPFALTFLVLTATWVAWGGAACQRLTVCEERIETNAARIERMDDKLDDIREATARIEGKLEQRP